MKILVTLLASAGFAALAALHVYWAAGGIWGATDVVPEVQGAPAFKPGPVVTLIVAALLAGAAAVVALQGGLVTSDGLPAWIPRVGAWVVAAAMAARAVGDFRLFGLFRQVRGTRFARLDTTVYAPLSLV